MHDLSGLYVLDSCCHRENIWPGAAKIENKRWSHENVKINTFITNSNQFNELINFSRPETVVHTTRSRTHKRKITIPKYGWMDGRIMDWILDGLSCQAPMHLSKFMKHWQLSSFFLLLTLIGWLARHITWSIHARLGLDVQNSWLPCCVLYIHDICVCGKKTCDINVWYIWYI